MIKVLINKENDFIDYVEIKGHAKYSEAGTDIVCAAVSSILLTTVNAIALFDNQAIDYQENSGKGVIKVLTKDEITEKLLVNMVNLLTELASDYPKNIKIM